METGTITGKFGINLRMRSPSLGWRMWLAAKLCGAAAYLLGGKLIIELEPEIAMQHGGQEPTISKLPSIGTLKGRAYWNGQ